jgi:hypothetical protein
MAANPIRIDITMIKILVFFFMTSKYLWFIDYFPCSYNLDATINNATKLKKIAWKTEKLD